MYSGAGGASSNFMGLAPSAQSSSNPPKGANISLEAFNEWKIQEIGWDGVEKYIRPESFSDHVGKLARQVNWSKLVGSDAVYDNPSLITEESEEENTEELTDGSAPKPEPKKEVPEAGPWHAVAKNLHESLQQLNVLLDNLHVMNSLQYSKPLTILDPSLAQHAPGAVENINNSKASQWVWKRRALSEASAVLEIAQKQRSISVEDEAHKLKGEFFVELKKIREYWRVRKTGEHIYGDLGYKIFGSKYDARELFDITRRAVPIITKDSKGETVQSILQVRVPCDLTRRSTIAVSVVRDDFTTKDLFGSGDDSELDYMKVNRKEVDNIPWQDALSWAQETLICRDTFNQLASDAVQLKTRLSTIRDGVLLVALHDDWLLRVDLKYHTFKEGVIPEEGCSYLNRSLRQMVVAEQCARWVRPQLFVDLPLTTLPDSLDSRGPFAFTQQEMNSRARQPRLLLERLLTVSAHYALVKNTVETLQEHIMESEDPQIYWRWLRSSPTHSHIAAHITNRNFDFVVGKFTFYIKISCDDVCVVTKEGQSIDCHRDPHLLKNTLRFMNSIFFATTVAQLGKVWWSFQVLHANMNAVDVKGNPAPTVYMCNAMSTRSILCQFHVDEEPVVSVKQSNEDCGETNEEGSFMRLNYKRLPGSSFCKKMDNLFAVLKENSS